MGIWRFMRKVLRAIAGWFAAPGRGSGGPAAAPPDDYLDLLKKHPGTRVTTVKLLDPVSAGKGVLSRHEHVETEDDDGNLRQIDAYHATLCNFGHLLSREVQPKGICRICGRLMCSLEGCEGRCSACGVACCANHRVTHKVHETEVTYCVRCRWRHWIKLWFGCYP